MFLGVACSPTVKGETERRDRFKGVFAKTSSQYPAFESVLKNKISETELKWAEALKVDDEKARIQAMKVVNDGLKPMVVLIGRFNRYQKTIADLSRRTRKMIDQNNSKYSTGSLYNHRYESSNNMANQSLDAARLSVSSAKPGTYTQAYKVYKSSVNLIKAGNDSIKTLYEDVSRYVRSKEEAEAQRKAKESEQQTNVGGNT